MGSVDDVLDQLGERHGHDYPDNEHVDSHERQDRMDVLGQQRVSQPAEQRRGEPHVRHHVAGTREDADGDRPSQRDANDGNEYDDGHAEQATLEEHAAHVIAQAPRRRLQARQAPARRGDWGRPGAGHA
jgi:hypothetical protein